MRIHGWDDRDGRYQFRDGHGVACDAGGLLYAVHEEKGDTGGTCRIGDIEFDFIDVVIATLLEIGGAWELGVQVGQEAIRIGV